jgi:glycerol-3-phosphate dehydrogenase
MKEIKYHSSRKPQVAVIGAGSWALLWQITWAAGNRVRLWVYEPEL